MWYIEDPSNPNLSSFNVEAVNYQIAHPVAHIAGGFYVHEGEGLTFYTKEAAQRFIDRETQGVDRCDGKERSFCRADEHFVVQRTAAVTFVKV